MRFRKSLNNNIALAVDDDGCEIIIIGTGVGFKKVKDQIIDQTTIQKTFRIGMDDKYHKIEQFFNIIPLQVIDVTERIIQYGKDFLNQTLNDSILLALADHIHFALERSKQGVQMQNPLHWDIRHLYPKEYAVGHEAVRLINEAFGVILPLSEASSIALHFVNAQYGSSSMDQTIKITKIINEIVDVMMEHFQTSLEQESVSFSRFITHLRYFIVRQFNKESLSFKDENFLYEVLSQRYPQSFECASKLKTMLEQNYSFNITADEMVYLMIHIERVTTSADEDGPML